MRAASFPVEKWIKLLRPYKWLDIHPFVAPVLSKTCILKVLTVVFFGN